ncbi:anti-sigma factor family protein [Bacillus horti]|uniref:Anti-sigma-W factor RsiW n=1 Tax=Caldalkalibacillus horti TaxID=77523 RepID=A0ABT9VX64_9BACI|nr:zf-HC2 domain-containing protein [Bacillus horti]MDQ0165485.1 hypothetical protein [Bacillus horti]
MKCQEVHSLIQHYFEGKVDEYTKIKVHHHLAQCPSCTENFQMWKRGDEVIQGSLTPHQVASPSTKPQVMSQVMERIKQEEKWANPTVKNVRSYKRKTKRAFTIVACMLMLFFAILVTSTFIPQQEVVTEETPSITNSELDQWEHTIVMKERIQGVETSMNFNVVASISDPLIYSMPEEEQNGVGYSLIFSVFGLLCIIISLSWITRV